MQPAPSPRAAQGIPALSVNWTKHGGSSTPSASVKEISQLTPKSALRASPCSINPRRSRAARYGSTKARMLHSCAERAAGGLSTTASRASKPIASEKKRHTRAMPPSVSSSTPAPEDCPSKERTAKERSSEETSVRPSPYSSQASASHAASVVASTPKQAP